MRDFDALLAEPPVDHPPVRVWRDWALVAVLIPTAVVEAILRDDLVFPVAAALFSIAIAVASLWRRSHPLLLLSSAFGVIIAMDIVAMIVVGRPVLVYGAGVVVVVTVYSLFRWASGRDAAIGLGVMSVSFVHSQIVDYSGVEDAIAGAIFFFAIAGLGWLVRSNVDRRAQRRNQIRLTERERLARELHDTVAHRVSAMAITAQAGRVLAKKSPEKAAESLQIIEEEATRALAEMRSIVGRLRSDDLSYTPPEFAPGPGLAEIEHLANPDSPTALHVEVEFVGDLHNLGPAIEATAYRLAQESVTNAIRHATNATRVEVSVIGNPDAVLVTIYDDGESTELADTSKGYGVIGMTERATLVGGTLAAGPIPGRGWRVEAVLPRGMNS